MPLGCPAADAHRVLQTIMVFAATCTLMQVKPRRARRPLPSADASRPRVDADQVRAAGRT